MNVVASMLCCPDVDGSVLSSPCLLAPVNLLPWQLPGLVETSCLHEFQPEDLDKGQGAPSWEPNAGEMCSLSSTQLGSR